MQHHYFLKYPYLLLLLLLLLSSYLMLFPTPLQTQPLKERKWAGLPACWGRR